MFRITPLQRNSGGECGSTASRRIASASRDFVRHTCAQPKNTRCTPVSPSITGAGSPSSESW